MENMEITVPLLSWLIGGSRIGGSYNIYCASLGTDPKLGCFGRKLFNYRIWIEKVEENEYLKACCYYGLNSFENQNHDEITVESYPLEEDSRELIKKYIEEKAKEYFEF